MTTSKNELLERAREFDMQALAEVYDRYAEPIYRYLYRYVGDAAQAEDLTSEVFLRFLQALDTSRAPRDRLDAWLYRVAHNLAMDLFRRETKSASVSLDEYPHLGEAGHVAAGEPPLANLEKDQGRQQLRATIRQLTPEQQRVILLRFGEGLPLAQVSRLMGKSEGAIKVLQHRAIQRLKKLLERRERQGK